MTRRKTLSFEQLAELPRILDLVGLKKAKLTPAERISLCNCFYSVPYDHRTDACHLYLYMELALRALKALDRADCIDTIREDASLVDMVMDMNLALRNLAPRAFKETQTTIALNDPLQKAGLVLRRAVDSLLGSAPRRQV